MELTHELANNIFYFFFSKKPQIASDLF